MGCSPEKVENPAASRSPDRHRWQAPPDPPLKPRKNTHFYLLKDASHTLRMEQPRPWDGSKVQTLAVFHRQDGRLSSSGYAAGARPDEPAPAIVPWSYGILLEVKSHFLPS